MKFVIIVMLWANGPDPDIVVRQVSDEFTCHLAGAIVVTEAKLQGHHAEYKCQPVE